MASRKKNEDSSADFPARKTFKGNWVCAECGKEVTELPFEPSGDRPIHCKDCWAKKREERGPRRSRDFGPQRTVQGNWKCSECGQEITELPFEPAGDRPIFCKECWAKKRSERFE